MIYFIIKVYQNFKNYKGYLFDTNLKMCAAPEKVKCSSSNPGSGIDQSTNPFIPTTNIATGFNGDPSNASGATTASIVNSTGSGCDLSREFTPVPNTGCSKFYRHLFLKNIIL